MCLPGLYGDNNARDRQLPDEQNPNRANSTILAANNNLPAADAKQKEPTRRDATSAKERATFNRNRATQTLLTQNNAPVDKSQKKSLLGY